MNPLYRNDRPGQMPRSWYTATAEPVADRAPLSGDRRCDLAIVGAGFTGLGLARSFLHVDRRARPARWTYPGSKTLWKH